MDTTTEGQVSSVEEAQIRALGFGLGAVLKPREPGPPEIVAWHRVSVREGCVQYEADVPVDDSGDVPREQIKNGTELHDAMSGVSKPRRIDAQRLRDNILDEMCAAAQRRQYDEWMAEYDTPESEARNG